MLEDLRSDLKNSSNELNDLRISDLILNKNMAVMHTPSVKAGGKKVPTPKPTLYCSVGGCSYSCKYPKYMRDHEFDVHGKETARDPMEASVNISDSTDDQTPSESREEAKVHDSMENRPHSTLNIEAGPSQEGISNKKKRGHSSDEEGEDGADKKKSREGLLGSEDDDEDDEEPLSQSPSSIERRRKQAEAKLALEGYRQKKEIMAILNSDDSNDGQGNIQVNPDVSHSLLEDTTIHPPVDSLDLTNVGPGVEGMEQETQESPDAVLLREAKEELTRRTKSLEDALADRDTLQTQLALERRSKQVLENRLTRTKKELEEAVETADGLRAAMADPSIHHSQEVNRVMAELTNANNKISKLSKELEKAKALRKEALDQADSSRRLAQSWEQRIQHLEGESMLLKKQTNCNNRDCHDEKQCGRSHANKPENRAGKLCDFFMRGYCNKAEECPFRHDPEARDRQDNNTSLRSNGSSTNSSGTEQVAGQQPREQLPPSNNPNSIRYQRGGRQGREGQRRGRGGHQSNQGGVRREEGNQSYGANTGAGGVPTSHQHSQNLPSSSGFATFSQQQQPLPQQQQSFQVIPPNLSQFGTLGNVNTNFGNQGIPQSLSGSMINHNNTWGINQPSQAAVLAQNMNRIQKQNELRNELMSTRNMLTMTINSGPQPGSIPM